MTLWSTSTKVRSLFCWNVFWTSNSNGPEACQITSSTHEHRLVCFSSLDIVCFCFNPFYMLILRHCEYPGEPFCFCVLCANHLIGLRTQIRACMLLQESWRTILLFTNLVIFLRHFVNCMFFVGILANPPAPERGTEKKKRAPHSILHSARGAAQRCNVARRAVLGKATRPA